MAKTVSEKAAGVLVDNASDLRWNPQLFIGTIMEAQPQVQRVIIDTFIRMLVCYRENAENPHLSYRTDPTAAGYVEAFDLTPFDQPW